MGHDILFHRRADWVGVVESLYEPRADEKDWAGAVVDSLRKAFPRDDEGGAAMVVIEHDATRRSRALPFVVGVGRSAGFRLSDVDPLGRRLFDALFYSPHLALTHTEALRFVERAEGDVLKGMHERWRNHDALGIVGHPEPGVIAFLARPLYAPRALAKHERKVLSHVALHLESAWRLRRRSEAVLAVVSPDGKLLHAERADTRTARLPEGVRRIESARTRQRRRDPEAIDVWQALVGGEASLVERFDGGKRYYVLLENAPSRRAHRALTRQEIEIVRLAARGLPVKLAAYGLGLSSARVSAALADAAAKLGLPSRLHLVRAASQLVDTPRARVDPAMLTNAEREIFELVRMGLSNAEIARRRGRSVRTVANQLASILQKTNSPTRRAVLAAMT
jgi:DNA-binding CsgD family transcriptional regulator